MNEIMPVPATAHFRRSVSSLERLSEANVARLVSAQFERVDRATGTAVMEMVVFGAILEAVDARLKARGAKHRNQHSGESLKAWLQLNCPEIHYQTAYSYLQAARGTRQLAKIADDVPLLPLMGEEPIGDRQMEKCRRKIMSILVKSSLRLLRGAAGGSRPKAKDGGEPVKYTDEERAMNKWADILLPAGDSYAKESVADLPRDKARAALDILTPLIAALRRRLDRED